MRDMRLKAHLFVLLCLFIEGVLLRKITALKKEMGRMRKRFE